MIFRKNENFIYSIIFFFLLQWPGYGYCAVADTKKEVVAVVLAWYTALGASNGRVGWKKDGLAYASVHQQQFKKWTDTLQNAPLLSKDFFKYRNKNLIGDEYLNVVRGGAAKELALMKAAGIDVFAFDMLPQPEFNPNNQITLKNEPFVFFNEFKIWLDEAEKLGMKGVLFADSWNMSGDFPKGRKLSSNEWFTIINYSLQSVKSHPAYWFRSNKPVLFHFATDKRMRAAPDPGATTVDGGWRDILNKLKANDLDIYFVSDVRQPEIEGDQWLAWVGAMYMFTPSSPSLYQAEYQKRVANKFGSNFFFTISPGYYRPKVGFANPSFERLDIAYKAAINSKSDVLVLLTWNDFEEETDIVPSLRKGRGLYDILSCYNRWYKTGVFSCKNEITFAYLNNYPVNQITPYSRSWGGDYRWSEKIASSDVYYWSFAPAGGANVKCGENIIKLASGVQYGLIPREKLINSKCEVAGVFFKFDGLNEYGVPSEDSTETGLRYSYLSLSY